MHGNLIFNRLSTEENGGIQKGQALDEAQETEDLLVKYIDATSEIQNNILFLSNEYRLGKTVEVDSADYVIDSFIPAWGSSIRLNSLAVTAHSTKKAWTTTILPTYTSTRLPPMTPRNTAD
jgi:hypothetical protein